MNRNQVSREHSYIGPRHVGSVRMTAQDVADISALGTLGIYLEPNQVRAMAAFAMDDQQGGVTTAQIGTPIQFLQAWLPGFVRVITAARKIDELVGISTVGNWEDEEVVQGVLEPIGNAVPYGDYTNIPLASWNPNFERRTIVRYEKGFGVGKLEEARSAAMRVNSAQEKRASAGLALDIERNRVGFYGYNSGANRTYGFLNDPSLPAYVNVANGASASPLWANKTFNEICADVRSAFAALQTQAQGNIQMDTPMTLAIPTSQAAYLSVTANLNGYSVRQWITDTFKNMRIVDAPQLTAANGGANVFYLYAETADDGATDDNKVWVQPVPAKLRTLGVENRSKSYVEDFANATAGVMLKRPWAVVRRSGI